MPVTMQGSDPFLVAGGQQAHSIQDLLNTLRSMNQATFNEHVNGQRNDFAAWIRHTHRHEKLAELLERVKSQEVMIHVLEAFVREQERLRQQSTQQAPSPQPTMQAPMQQPAPQASPQPAPQAPPQSEHPEATPELPPEPEQAEENFNSDPHPHEEEQLTEEEAHAYANLLVQMQKEVSKVFIGQDEVVKRVLLCLVCEAHSLLEGVPGLAKSLLVETLSRVIGGTTFHRIQFLPDMLPADIIGGQIYNPRTGEFSTMKGPVFANFILADEINRAPPKTHAALMEVMQEKKVTIDKNTYPLDRPFLVIATQNPLENKGTYALPEAVLDRFMFKIDLDYPLRKHERIILTDNATTKAGLSKTLKVVVHKEELKKMQKRVKTVFISNRIRDYILDLLEATRGKNKNIEGMKFVKYGAGPRAGIYLAIGAKARAMQQGRNYVLPEDIDYVMPDVLRHRVALNFTGKAHGVSSDKIVQEITSKVTAL